MSSFTRRDFIKNSLAAAAGVGITSTMPAAVRAKVRGANEDIRVAVVGVGNQGTGHIGYFHSLEGVRVVALCDTDRAHLDREAKKFDERNEKVDTYIDVRKLLDDKNIDAITIATPNHWHSLITIWACQAGKDVYVEKPVSHNIWEGRKMVAAARKYNRIVQTGTQSRSDDALQKAIQYIREGNLGKLLFARGLCYRDRRSIGKVNGPQPVPDTLDYNLWTGPAPLTPLMRTRLHYDWHWVWPTGNGDLGNQGIHQMDMCRWAIGANKLPPRVMSIGGRFGYDDDGQTANTQIVLLDYKPAPIIFEVRGLPRKKDDTAFSNYRGIRVGVVLHCEGGYVAGGWAYDKDGNKIKQFKRDGGSGHHANFIKAVHSRKVSDLNADIIEGHLSSALCHMGNISHRLGKLTSTEEIQEAIKDNADIKETFERFQEHLFLNWVDLSKTKATLGPPLTMDTQKERFVADTKYGLGRWANELLKRDYRKPFVVPEKV